MSTNWSDDIVICDLADEPALSEELNDIYAKLRDTKPGTMPNLILNLGGVTYLNSSNIAQMLRLRKALIESDRRLKLCSVADPVWSIMLLTGLDKVFQFFPDKANAIAAMQMDMAKKK
ncbi:MAG: STAS domain-containing protein [Phycisphaerales bacterium]|nr:STAS domain-containing protein [Phycisphaerales bacterium]